MTQQREIQWTVAPEVAVSAVRDNALPSPLDPDLRPAVAEAVAQQAQVERPARKPCPPDTVTAGVRTPPLREAQQASLQLLKKNTAATNAA